ncbi:MAG: deoxyguanosinetriphosphate triphosphohydrolase [Solirubrobacterales bacterium]
MGTHADDTATAQAAPAADGAPAPGAPRSAPASRPLSERTSARERGELWELAVPSYPARRAQAEPESPMRTPFQRDRDRIVHSKAFRRLKHKTQVFIAPEGDHYRTRLTHTLEASSISRGVARALGLNEDLTEAISLGHDLGHPPFGHIGEEALDRALAAHSDRRFRHNEHSLRVVDSLERDGRGLNLTEQVRDGILHHTGAVEPASLEGAVVRLVDRVAYINHDIDDAIRAGILVESDLPSDEIDMLGTTGSDRIDALARDIVDTSAREGAIAQSPELAEAMQGLRSYMFERVYLSPQARAENDRVQRMLQALFEHYAHHAGELPAGAETAADTVQRVTDYLAGMTDRYCIATFKALSVPEESPL